MAHPIESYRSYHDLPAVAGVATMAEAARPGLSVEEVVRRHKRHHFALKRLFEILTAKITAEPIYELKTAFSLHAYLCAEHVTALRTRVAEMREPPLHAAPRVGDAEQRHHHQELHGGERGQHP